MKVNFKSGPSELFLASLNPGTVFVTVEDLAVPSEKRNVFMTVGGVRGGSNTVVNLKTGDLMELPCRLLVVKASAEINLFLG